MTISAPIVICGASGNAASNAANATTLTTAAAIGDLIVIGLGNANTGASLSTCVDSAGNHYTLVQFLPVNGSAANQALAWCISKFTMPIGTSFTATTSAGSWNFDGIWKVAAVNGLTVNDVSSSGTVTGTTTGTSQSTGTLAHWNEIIFGQANLNTSVTYTESAGFTNLTGAGGSSYGGMGYKIVSSPGSNTWAPGWTSQSIPVCWQLISFGTAIGIPTNAGFNIFSGSTTSTLTTTAPIPAGALVVVAVWINVANTGAAGIGVSDGINTWFLAIGTPATASTYGCALFYCSNCKAIPSGTTLTTSGGSGNPSPIGVAYVAGANGGLDKTGTADVSALTLSASTGTLSIPSEVVFATLNTNSSFSTYVEGAGFISVYGNGSQQTAGNTDFAASVVIATTSVTWAPSWTASQIVSGAVASFKVSPASSVTFSTDITITLGAPFP